MKHHNKSITAIAALATAVANMPATPKAAPAPKAVKAPPASIPEESERLYASLKPEFAPETKHWLIGAKSGALVFAARVADVRVIASCLLSKLTSLPIDKEGGLDRDKLKVVRASFGKLAPDARVKWEEKALPLFKSALKDYHAATKPLKKAVFDNKDFGLRSLRLTLAKSGNIAVTTRHSYVA